MFPDVKFLGLDLYEWCITVGVIAALVVFRVYADKKKLSARLQNFCIIVAFFAIVLGYGSAVLFQAVYDYIASGVFHLGTDTGATFYGGLIGGAAVFLLLYFTLGKKLCGREIFRQFGNVCGSAACGIVLAHAIGRIGCLMAGCCYGRETDSIIGMYLPAVGKTVIPTQLIESLFLFLLFAVLSVLFFRTKINCLYVYMIAYAVFRFLIEFLRDDDRGMSPIPGLSPSQFWSVLLFAAGIGLLLFSLLRKKKEEPPKEVVAALIFREDRFFICRRPEGKARALLWEFVGGKVEEGETKQEALVRECEEELGITVSVGEVFCEVTHEYPDLTVHLTLFRAEIAEGEPQKREHAELAWITPGEIENYEFCPADEGILEKIKAEASACREEDGIPA